MNKEILDLEKSLFKYQYMSDINYLDKIIDDTYKEMGKSGKIITKKDVISELSNLKEDRNIIIYNYEFNQINNNIYLIHYITKNDEKLIYRTSM